MTEFQILNANNKQVDHSQDNFQTFFFVLHITESGFHNRRGDGIKGSGKEEGPEWRGAQQTAGQTPSGQGQQPANQRLG